MLILIPKFIFYLFIFHITTAKNIQQNFKWCYIHKFLCYLLMDGKSKNHSNINTTQILVSLFV